METEIEPCCPRRHLDTSAAGADRECRIQRWRLDEAGCVIDSRWCGSTLATRRVIREYSYQEVDRSVANASNSKVFVRAISGVDVRFSCRPSRAARLVTPESGRGKCDHVDAIQFECPRSRRSDIQFIHQASRKPRLAW